MHGGPNCQSPAVQGVELVEEDLVGTARLCQGHGELGGEEGSLPLTGPLVHSWLLKG